MPSKKIEPEQLYGQFIYEVCINGSSNERLREYIHADLAEIDNQMLQLFVVDKDDTRCVACFKDWVYYKEWRGE